MERLLTSEEVAEALRIDVVTVRRLVGRGELAAYRVGGEYRFRVQDVEAYLAANRVSAEARPTQEAIGGLVRGLAQRVSRPRPGQVMPGGPFRRYSEEARKVMVLAHEEALRYSHGGIGTEHLVIGLVRLDKGIAPKVLNGLGVDLAKARQVAESRLGRPDREEALLPGTEGERGITDRVKRTFDLTVKEAEVLHHEHIGPEHLLLGLVRESETSDDSVIQALGLDPKAVREAVLREMGGRANG